ncbi:hypothetical protein EGW08_020555, partial [Elysia chlorotica]
MLPHQSPEFPRTFAFEINVRLAFVSKMASSISDERLREMEEEMDRFEAEIEGPQDASGAFILGAKTFDRVQAQLTAIRHDMSSGPDRGHHPPRGGESSRNQFGDEDFRHHLRPGQKRRHEADEDEQFFDIDERPGRPQGP